MVQEKKIDYSKKKPIKKRQSIWNYIRRNRQFRVGDVMMICEVNYSYMQKFLRFLQKAEYIRHDNEYKPYTNRRYTLLKNSGSIAPLITDYGLYDNNTQEVFRFGKCKAEQKIYAPEALMKIVKVIKDDKTTKKILIKEANITKTMLTKWWKRLQKIGVILERIKADKSDQKYTWCKVKYKKDADGGYIYRCDCKRAKEILDALNKGAYTNTNSQMKQLWIH